MTTKIKFCVPERSSQEQPELKTQVRNGHFVTKLRSQFGSYQNLKKFVRNGLHWRVTAYKVSASLGRLKSTTVDGRKVFQGNEASELKHRFLQQSPRSLCHPHLQIPCTNRLLLARTALHLIAFSYLDPGHRARTNTKPGTPKI